MTIQDAAIQASMCFEVLVWPKYREHRVLKTGYGFEQLGRLYSVEIQEQSVEFFADFEPVFLEGACPRKETGGKEGRSTIRQQSVDPIQGSNEDREN